MRILAIEDSAGDVELLFYAIRKCAPHAIVEVVPDVQALLEHLAARDAAPDLILSDMLHPGNGDRSIQILTHVYPGVPIIVLTAGDDQTVARALEAGADEAHQKALGMLTFIEQIAEIVGRWERRNGR